MWTEDRIIRVLSQTWRLFQIYPVFLTETKYLAYLVLAIILIWPLYVYYLSCHFYITSSDWVRVRAQGISNGSGKYKSKKAGFLVLAVRGWSVSNLISGLLIFPTSVRAHAGVLWEKKLQAIITIYDRFMTCSFIKPQKLVPFVNALGFWFAGDQD